MLVEVQAIANNELIGNGEAYPVGLQGNMGISALGLIQHSAGLYAVSSSFLEVANEMRKCFSAVHDVLDNDKVDVGKVVSLYIEVYVDISRGYCLRAV